MKTEEIIKRIRRVIDGIDGDSFTVENLERLINDIKNEKSKNNN